MSSEEKKIDFFLLFCVVFLNRVLLGTQAATELAFFLSCLSLSSSMITGLCHYIWFKDIVFKQSILGSNDLSFDLGIHPIHQVDIESCFPISTLYYMLSLSRNQNSNRFQCFALKTTESYRNIKKQSSMYHYK